MGGQALSPQPVVGIMDAAAVQAGANSSCALLMDGTVSCWGYNADGQLGTNSPVCVDCVDPTPAAVVNLSGVAEIALGFRHACARRTDGTVACWGDNQYGQLGDGMAPTDAPVPVEVSGLTGAVAIGAGNDHTCAFLDDGTATCWGRNHQGQLGDGTMTDSPVPVAVVGL